MNSELLENCLENLWRIQSQKEFVFKSQYCVSPCGSDGHNGPSKQIFGEPDNTIAKVRQEQCIYETITLVKTWLKSQMEETIRRKKPLVGV